MRMVGVVCMMGGKVVIEVVCVEWLVECVLFRWVCKCVCVGGGYKLH